MSRRRRKTERLASPVPGDPDRVSGRKLLKLIERPLRALRNSDAMPRHGNRQLLAYHIVVAHLIAFFNPLAATLRRVEDVFEAPKTRKRLGLPRVPRATLADAQALFDPTMLVPIIDELKRQIPDLPHDPRLDAVSQKIVAVDGTFFDMLPRVLWAMHHRHDCPDAQNPRGHVRVDLHFDIVHGTPDGAVVSGSDLSEQQSLAENLQPGRFYVMDRGFQAYSLLRDIIDASSDFVVRFRKDIAYDTLTERPLNAEDRLAGVIGDADIHIRGHRAKVSLKAPQLRRIDIQTDDADNPVILLTNRRDLPANLIGLIYRHRWQIELFFRWLKCMTGFGHFMSDSLAGVTLQIYAALIGTLLIAVSTGSKPSVYAFTTMCHVMSGLIDADEAPAIIARRQRIAQRDAETAKARRAAKKLQR